MFYKTVIDF